MTLRESTARGGLYLAMREGVGIFVRLLGILFLTREIGPTSYGVYVTAYLVVAVLASVAQLGAEVYLIRRPDEPTEKDYDQTFSLLLLTSAVAVAVGFGLSFVLPYALDSHAFVGPLRIMLISLPLNVLWAPAQAKIERAFRYKAMAWVELGGDLLLYTVSLGIAYSFSATVWAPVIGFICWQAFLLIGSHIIANYVPRWAWSKEAVKARLHFGTSYAGAGIFDQLRDLLNPLVVGRYLGAAAVGRVALALRVVEALSFAGRATWRLALVSFSRVQKDRSRLSRGLSEAMGMQILTLAPLLCTFAILAPALVPLGFGSSWKPLEQVFPFVAIAGLANSVQLPQATVLFILNKPLVVTRFTLTSLTINVTAALLLVPSHGLAGYGISVVIAQTSIYLLHRALKPYVDTAYSMVLPWLFAAIPLLFVRSIPVELVPLFVLPSLVVLAMPARRRQVWSLVSLVLGAVKKRGDALDAPDSSTPEVSGTEGSGTEGPAAPETPVSPGSARYPAVDLAVDHSLGPH